MSRVSFMDKLLDRAEVEWRPLGEVVHMRAGQHISASNIMEEVCSEYPYPCFGGNGIRGFVAKNSHDGKHLLIGRQGALCGNVQRANGRFYATEHAVVVTPSDVINIDWAFHLLTLMNLNQYASKSAQPGLAVGKIESLNIPIPCPNDPKKSLEIQAEIVRILDAFTELTVELTAKLTAELTARKKQYNYYREKLLNFEEGEANHLPMGQEGVGEFIRGGGLQKKDFTEAGVGCIHYGQIYTHYGTYASTTKTCVSREFAKKARKAKSGDLVIATTSENDEDVCKAVAWLGCEEIAVSSDACIYRHNLNPKYVSYFFQTEQFRKQKRQYITGTKVRRVNADNLAKILIPVPSQDEQERIVAILDKFDRLTNSITEGLSREIKLRQKQYEYYRDLLLSFPKPEAAKSVPNA